MEPALAHTEVNENFALSINGSSKRLLVMTMFYCPYFNMNILLKYTDSSRFIDDNRSNPNKCCTPRNLDSPLSLMGVGSDTWWAWAAPTEVNGGYQCSALIRLDSMVGLRKNIQKDETHALNHVGPIGPYLSYRHNSTIYTSIIFRFQLTAPLGHNYAKSWEPPNPTDH